MIIALILVVFIELLTYLIIFDVILSWLTIIGIKFRPKFIADTIDPMYKKVRNVIPTTFGPLDFTPIVVIIILLFLQIILFSFFPGLQTEFNDLMSKITNIMK